MFLKIQQRVGMLVSIAVVFCWVDSVSAHPGHGAVSANHPFHFVFEPVHAVGWLTVVLLFSAVAWLTIRRQWLRSSLGG